MFLEGDVAQGRILRGKRSRIRHNFIRDVDPGYIYFEKFRGGVQRYMMESKDLISPICFKLRNESNKLISFNGQSLTFRLSIKQI